MSDDRDDRDDRDERDERDENLDLAGAPAAEAEPAPPSPRRGRGGVSGSVLAAAMLGLRDALEGKPKEDIVIQVDAAGDPPDIDLTGLDDPLDAGARMTGPPLDTLKERAAASRRERRKRR
jgi:hypothetical protein